MSKFEFIIKIKFKSYLVLTDTQHLVERQKHKNLKTSQG